MKLLLNILNEVPEYQPLEAALEAGRSPVEVAGLSPVHRAHFAAGLLARLDAPVVLVCADESECTRLAADVTALTGVPATVIGAREFLFHEGAVASKQPQNPLPRMYVFSASKSENLSDSPVV